MVQNVWKPTPTKIGMNFSMKMKIIQIGIPMFNTRNVIIDPIMEKKPNYVPSPMVESIYVSMRKNSYHSGTNIIS